MTAWVGKDVWGGNPPSQGRQGSPAPPHWRLEAVAAVDRPHHLVVSPGRDRVAFVHDRADLGSDIWVMDAGGGPPVQASIDRAPVAFWEDTAPAWSPDATHLANPAEGSVHLVAVAGGPSRRLVEGGSPVWLPDGRMVVTIEQDRARAGTELPRVTHVARLAVVDPADPWPRPITAPTADPGQATPSPDGTRIAYTRYPPDDRNRSDIVVLDLGTGEETTLAGAAMMHAHSPAWSPDGQRVAYLSEEPGWYEIFIVGAAGGGDRRQLTHQAADLGSLRWSDDGARLAATRTRRGRADLVTIDAFSGEATVLAAGGEWSDPGWTADGEVVAIFEDHAAPPRVERVGLDGTRVVLFDPTPAPVRSAPHVRPIEVTYPSADGLEIAGFLFRPARSQEPAPVVVYPHGGPTSHYGDSWDGHAQYFLDKGYGWFAINFRGSTSYGRDFERANHGRWGTADTDDCLAAADFLGSLDWVDPTRIAIFGASYGSYLALSALVRDPELWFACGVAKYGDCDILTSWAQGAREGVEDLERQMGHPADHPEWYRDGSPIHRIEAIERPILIAHGERDEVVSPLQSEQLVAALDRLGKTYEYVTYPTEGHGLLHREPQLHFYRRLERFLDWYLM